MITQELIQQWLDDEYGYPYASANEIHVFIAKQAIEWSLNKPAELPQPKPASFQLTTDQQNAIDGILRDIRSPDAHPVLCGYAGTGKTVTTAALVQELVSRNNRVVVATPTHKARSQVEKALKNCGAKGFEAVTVHRLLGLKQVRNKQTGKESFEPDKNGNNMLTKATKWDPDTSRVVDIDPVDTIIVDETSMLSSELYELLLREAGKRPVIFVGDDRQLLPVGEEQVCRAFTEGTSMYRLTEVLRHDGAILNLATATRQLPLGRAVFSTAEGGGSRVQAYRSREHWREAALDFAASHEAMSDPDYCRVLAWTNEAVDKLNTQIHHRRYGIDAPQFVEGMTCVTVDAIPSPDGDVPLLNSTLDVLIEEAEFQLHHFPGEPTIDEPWETWKLTVTVPPASFPVTFRVIGINHQKRWQQSLRDIAVQAKAASGRDRSDLWEEYFKRKDYVGKLQPASALTIHKSQGSTFQHVFLHWTIDGFSSAPTALQNQLAYVGITRASESLHVVADR